MKNHLLATLLYLSPMYVSATMTISVITVPETVNGYFTARVVGGPSPGAINPCWGYGNLCRLSLYTIDELWLPAGRGGYVTTDVEGYTSSKPPNSYPTLEEWWNSVRDKNRNGSDYLPAGLGVNPCVVLAAGISGEMIEGTIVSNCAKGIVQAKTCDVKPNNINVDLHAALGGTAPTVNVNNVTLTCTDDASVLIETNSRERIPLGGASDSYALLDWGAGFGKPKTVKAHRNVAEKLPLRVRGVSLDLLGAGQFTGSAIVNVSYN
ncbi:abortive infection protein [Serratia quinivorans]|jgi:hypothetical protein|uniref:abortive infection protein n=1 Tax=Serratia quinivorans TaxID=137545 RepID=UPI000D9DB293|nr:abortive infection protein [Serratia quinivorans]QBX66411.1 abortive infection protein [Serratia quinivorans]SPZ66027.1 Uncharacterised protein [Serratia quinivorans]